MRIKILPARGAGVGFVHKGEDVFPGDVLEVEDHWAARYIAQGVAIPAEGQTREASAPDAPRAKR